MKVPKDGSKINPYDLNSIKRVKVSYKTNTNSKDQNPYSLKSRRFN